MASDRDEELQRLENHLLAAEQCQVSSARVSNRDKTDVNFKKYVKAVEGKKRKGGIWVLIILLATALALFLYLVWGGKLPWN